MIKVVIPLFSLILAAACSASVPADGLSFDPSSGKAGASNFLPGNYPDYEPLLDAMGRLRNGMMFSRQTVE